jgi:hypothetical protein
MMHLKEWKKMHLSSYKLSGKHEELNFSLFSEDSTNSIPAIISLLLVRRLIQGNGRESFLHDELALCSQQNYISKCHYIIWNN